MYVQIYWTVRNHFHLSNINTLSISIFAEFKHRLYASKMIILGFQCRACAQNFSRNLDLLTRKQHRNFELRFGGLKKSFASHCKSPRYLLFSKHIAANRYIVIVEIDNSIAQ